MLDPKSSLSRLVHDLETCGADEFIIARTGPLAARLVPLLATEADRSRRIGVAKGRQGAFRHRLTQCLHREVFRRLLRMRVLLDTHIALSAVTGSAKLAPEAARPRCRRSGCERGNGGGIALKRALDRATCRPRRERHCRHSKMRAIACWRSRLRIPCASSNPLPSTTTRSTGSLLSQALREPLALITWSALVALNSTAIVLVR